MGLSEEGTYEWDTAFTGVGTESAPEIGEPGVSEGGGREEDVVLLGGEDGGEGGGDEG